MRLNLDLLKKLMQAYELKCKPLCKQIHMPQTAIDILLFLANNPNHRSARDIVEFRKIKANLVSINIDKLEKEGYIERKNIEGDKRKMELICTKKANPILEKGKAIQNEFINILFNNIDEASTKQFITTIHQMETNIDILLKLDY